MDPLGGRTGDVDELARPTTQAHAHKRAEGSVGAPVVRRGARSHRWRSNVITAFFSKGPMITGRQLLERGAIGSARLLLGRSISTAAAASTYLQPLDCEQIT